MADLTAAVRRDVDLDVTVVDVRGVLSPRTTAIMRDTLTQCLAECPSALVVDVTKCSVMSLAALCVVRMVARRRIDHPRVRVVVVDSRRRLLGTATAALDPVMTYADLDSAMAAAAAARSRVPSVRAGIRRSVAAPAKARDVVGAACAHWGIGELSRSAQLVVSELVTNAVIHAGTDIGLEATLRGDFLHLRVRDGSLRPPLLGPPGLAGSSKAELIDHGRGLPIVRGLCAGWGFVVNHAGDGKVVWASLRRGPELDLGRKAFPGRLSGNRS
jgi:anti-sigma regulatory factor (Ser/Thr protein kinase)